MYHLCNDMGFIKFEKKKFFARFKSTNQKIFEKKKK